MIVLLMKFCLLARLIVFLNNRYIVFRAKFTLFIIVFQIQAVLFHTSLKKAGKFHKCKTEMSNAYFCLTSISNEKRENTIVQSPPLTSLSLYSTTPFVI